MCAGCAGRFRQQWKLPELATPIMTLPSFAPGMAFLRVAATAVLIVGFMLEARLLDDVRMPVRLTSAPETVLLPPPVATDGQTIPAPAVPARPTSAQVRVTASATRVA